MRFTLIRVLILCPECGNADERLCGLANPRHSQGHQRSDTQGEEPDRWVVHEGGAGQEVQEHHERPEPAAAPLAPQLSSVERRCSVRTLWPAEAERTARRGPQLQGSASLQRMSHDCHLICIPFSFCLLMIFFYQLHATSVFFGKRVCIVLSVDWMNIVCRFVTHCCFS